jgi:KDEL-tailed cysteine endopeptidase
MNDFSDMTNEEFSALHMGFDPDAANKDTNKDNSLQSTADDDDGDDYNDDDDYDNDDETLLNATMNATMNSTRNLTSFLPRYVDWRKSRAVSAVKNQGQCGGCWSFAAAGALEGLYAIRHKKLVGLSVQQMLDCANSMYGNNGCSGGIMTGAYQYTNQHGIEPAANYEYTASVGACRQNARRVLFKNKGHREVPVNNWRALKRAVAKQPVSVGISAASQVVQLYKRGIITTGCYTNLDHGVLIVGYGHSAAKGLGYWIVKNSWGPTWGLGGYMHVAMGSQNGGKGVCGINQMASYPTF